jgi:signal transduction histidine kinase
MFTRFSATPNRASDQQGGLSLIWMLFPAVALVMVATFLAFQFLGIDPDTAGLSLAERMNFSRLLGELGDIQLFMLPLMVLMMVGVLAALQLGLRPLRQISERAASIGPATIGERLSLRSAPSEVVPLVTAFNGALDRLEAGWRAQQEFSANAAHELRTPLATLRALVEGALAPVERKDAIEELDRLSRLIAQLLYLAEAESGVGLEMTSFDLVELARTITGDMAASIIASGRGVGFEAACERWECRGAPGLVEVALRNLLENATRHTSPNSEILVSIDAAGQLIVSDDGLGVSPDIRDRLFQRFSKADARGKGAGLGLSIVKRVMLLHGGEARLEPSYLGARFVLDFSRRGSEAHAGEQVSRTLLRFRPLFPIANTLSPVAEETSATHGVNFRRQHI